MQCLIEHKNDMENVKCSAGIEHFQLVSLKRIKTWRGVVERILFRSCAVVPHHCINFHCCVCHRFAIYRRLFLFCCVTYSSYFPVDLLLLFIKRQAEQVSGATKLLPFVFCWPDKLKIRSEVPLLFAVRISSTFSVPFEYKQAIHQRFLQFAFTRQSVS